jgi:lytic murein transglycosylase
MFPGTAVMALAATGLLLALAAPSQAAECSDSGGRFDAWKEEFAKEAEANGIKAKGLQALAATTYATKTISADRNQKSFKLTFEQFMARRGGRAIAQKGKTVRSDNAAFFDQIERKYGVPAGPLIAIWGMETGFGGYLGSSNIVSAVATLAYDCRRSEFFTEQLNAALKLVDSGVLTSDSIGAAHGEIGQTQFLPANVVKFGVDGDGDGQVDLIGSGADAVASTANFLRGHGWVAGEGYQPGQPNYAAIAGWNAAKVYQQAIAAIGADIDG